jgi:hypothetical protein
MIQRKKRCKQPTCDVKTLHKLTFSVDGLRRVWECTNCGHQTPVRTLTLRDVEAINKDKLRNGS